MSLSNDLSLYDGLWDDFPGVPDGFGEVQDGGESAESESGSASSEEPREDDAAAGVLFPDLNGLSCDQKNLHLLSMPLKKPPEPKKVMTIRVRNPEGKYIRMTKDDLLNLKPLADDDNHSECLSENMNEYDKGGKSMSKNAILARENRQRRKAYVSNLESSVKKLSSENRTLKENTKEMEGTVSSLQKELSYLKAVLANQSTLSSLLQNITETPGVNFKSSCAPKTVKTDPVELKRKSVIAANRRLIEKENEEEEADSKRQKVDHDYAVPAGGVCLHVSNKEVSLEFCSSCSENAASAPRIRRGRPSRNK